MKKANTVINTIVIIIILVGFGMISLIGYQEFKNIKPDLMLDLELNESKQVMTDTENRFPSFLDGIILLVFLGLWLSGIVASVVAEEHPLIFGLMMFLLIFVVIAGAILGNFYEEFFQDTEFTGLVASFPITNWILTHMLQLSIVVGLSILLTMMAKNSL